MSNSVGGGGKKEVLGDAVFSGIALTINLWSNENITNHYGNHARLISLLWTKKPQQYIILYQCKDYNVYHSILTTCLFIEALLPLG